MATKYYGINDKWTDDDVENVIEIASEDGSVNSVKVNGEDYGGGGGGFTTSHIKINIVGPVADSQTFGLTLTIDDEIVGLFNNGSMYVIAYDDTLVGGTSKTYDVIILGSHITAGVQDGSQPVSTTGAVTVKHEEDSYWLEISGDCEVTFNTES